MPQSTVIGLIEIEAAADTDFDSSVDVLRRDPRVTSQSRLDTPTPWVYQFAVANTELVEADLVRLAMDLEHDYQQFSERMAKALGENPES